MMDNEALVEAVTKIVLQRLAAPACASCGSAPAQCDLSGGRVVAPVCGSAAAQFDLSGRHVVAEADVRALDLRDGAVVRVDRRALVTALASDFVAGRGARIER